MTKNYKQSINKKIIYKQLITEKSNEYSRNIDQQSTKEILTIINQEDDKVVAAVKQVLPIIIEVVDLIFSRFKDGGRLIYLGAGSSGRIGILDASEMDPTFNVGDNKIIGLIAGGNNAFIKPVEGAEDNERLAIDDLTTINLTKQDIVLGIAASGTTPYVLSGFNFAKHIGALTIGLCMTTSTAMNQDADKVINVLTGPEVISGSTRMKAGTATKMVLNMISTTLMIKLGKVYQNFMIDLKASNHKLRFRAINIVMEIAKVSEEKALKALEASNYSCRHALVMINKNVDFAQSQKLLMEHNHHLREIIG